jgi:hypothetical protein
MECPNCSAPYGDLDVFCENCGYDFISGTLPEPAEPAPTGVDPQEESAAPASNDVAIVSVDPAFFERMRFEGVDVPDPLPSPVQVTLPASDVLIGRHSSSRGVFPDIDLRGLFAEPDRDPAVSTTHARLRRTDDGGWTVTDLGSTNGTFLGDSTEELPRGSAVPIEPGTPVFVGAWTRIELTATEPPEQP